MAGRQQPDPARAIASYRRLAVGYDRATRRAAPVRAQAVALAGTKLFPWWLAPLNLYVWLANWSYMTTFEGLSRPWSHLQREHAPDLAVRQIWMGASYVARGPCCGSRTKPREQIHP